MRLKTCLLIAAALLCLPAAAQAAPRSKTYVISWFTQAHSYTRDQKPGDVTGDQIYDVMVNDGSHPHIADVAPTTDGWALYWAYLEPN